MGRTSAVAPTTRAGDEDSEARLDWVLKSHLEELEVVLSPNAHVVGRPGALAWLREHKALGIHVLASAHGDAEREQSFKAIKSPHILECAPVAHELGTTWPWCLAWGPAARRAFATTDTPRAAIWLCHGCFVGQRRRRASLTFLCAPGAPVCVS